MIRQRGTTDCESGSDESSFWQCQSEESKQRRGGGSGEYRQVSRLLLAVATLALAANLASARWQRQVSLAPDLSGPPPTMRRHHHEHEDDVHAPHREPRVMMSSAEGGGDAAATQQQQHTRDALAARAARHAARAAARAAVEAASCDASCPNATRFFSLPTITPLTGRAMPYAHVAGQ